MTAYTAAEKEDTVVPTQGFSFGVLFVAIGILLILENLDFLSYDLSHILISWPMLLIVIGIFNLSRKATSAGVILIGIGTYFMLPRIFDLPEPLLSQFLASVSGHPRSRLYLPMEQKAGRPFQI